MDYFEIGNTIDYTKYNALCYILRKFKRLTTSIKLGEKNITDEYGTYRFIGDFTNVNGNYILEEPINIYADDVFKNAIYEFVFNIINVDTSEEINRRIIYKQGDTGDDGILNITLPEDMIEDNEVIMPQVAINVIFDAHEYQNNLSSFKISLDVEYEFLEFGTNKITLTILEEDDTPVSDITTTIYINNTQYQVTTDANGKAEYDYQYTGIEGKVIVRSNGATAVFFDGVISFGWNEFTETELARYTWQLLLGYNSQYNVESWLPTNGDAELLCELSDDKWLLNNPKAPNIFTSVYYSLEPITEILYKLHGDIIAIGPNMFDSAYGLTWINIPRGIERIDRRAFYFTYNLKSITIPDTVYSLGESCFFGSGIEEIKIPSSINSIDSLAFYGTRIKKYELEWIGNQIIRYNKLKFPIIDETVFYIPPGETANYVAKNYPEDRLNESGERKTSVIRIDEPQENGIYQDTNLIPVEGYLLDEDDEPVKNKRVNINIRDILGD